MAAAYTLEQTDLDEHWDQLVAASPDGTIFCTSVYLSALDVTAEVYVVRKGQEPVALVLLASHDFVIYSGVMHIPQQKKNRSQLYSDRYRINEFVAEELPARYATVEFQLPPSEVDIRAYQWYRYGEEAPKYAIDVRYTSVIDITGFRETDVLEETPLFAETSVSRKQEIRYARRAGVTTEERFDPDAFTQLYARVFNRQSLTVDETARREMHALLTALETAGKGRMFAAYTAEGALGSMAYFAVDEKRAYYLFGANDPEYRRQHVGSAVIWEALPVLARAGIDEVDLEGINSPHRGWFKLSFGGDIRPYYRVRYPDR